MTDALDTTPETPTDDVRSPAARIVLELVRISIGWTFLWAFLDKLLGLGFSTCRADDGSIDVACDAAFVQGGSPAYGFLEFGTENSHTGDLFSWLASSGPTTQNVTDYLFMSGLAGIGLSLTFGFMVRIGAAGGVLMYTFMYLAGFVWPANNPFWDDHLLGALLCVGLIAADAGRRLGVGSWWRNVEFVRDQPLLH